MTFLDYLTANGNESERFDFNSPDEAYQFGNGLRGIIDSEGESKFLNVDISNTVVRVRLKEFEPVPA